MTTDTIAIRPTGWTVLRAVRWARVLGASQVLLVVALLVQPPATTPAQPAKADPVLYARAEANPGATYSVIVREALPASTAAEDLVRSLGGTITRELRIVGGFSATVPGSAVAPLTGSSAVWRVWGDAHIQMSGSSTTRYDRMAANTVWQYVIGLDEARRYANGAGVGVALVDTGVVPVPDLVNHVVKVIDLTGEHDGFDRFGHGSHMAGIIVGDGTSSNGTWTGVAPGARLISIKVAGVDGSTDVSVVMAALQWAVTHRAEYNIRVLNLSFGTDSTQSYSVDPLDYAVEQAWRAGIFVSVAAGNRGSGVGTINKPGDDPYVMTVGAADLKNTADKYDDVVADFSSRGPTQDGFSKPDLVAPGTTIVSVRDSGSLVDNDHPDARVGESYFKGTGTSQAAAVVSGVAALVLQVNPSLSPDQVKMILLKKARDYLAVQVGAGAGLLNAAGSVSAAMTRDSVPRANQGLTPSTGRGSLEASRGTLHVYVMQCAAADTNCQPVLLQGEVDALGNSWSGNSWSGNSWSGNSWSANSWSGVAWEANSWSGNSWSGNSWSGNSWSGTSWSGNSWSGNSWSGNSWSAGSWSGNSWSGNSWSGNSWSANSWSANSWSGNSWS